MASPVEEMVEVDGATLWTASQGAGRPVVWCHGGPGGTDLLDTSEADLGDGVRLHRYEQRACGRSSGGPPYTMARWIADLDRLREHWGHSRWIVAGHSFGAALALAYALEHPAHTEAVIYVSSVVRLAGQPDWYEHYRQARLERLPRAERSRFHALRRRRDQLARSGAQDATIEAALAELTAPTDFGDPQAARERTAALVAEMTNANRAVNRELGADFQRYFAAPERPHQVQRLDLPVLLVHGDADPRPLEAVVALADELPRSQLVTLEGAGHLPFWEAPDRFWAILRSFLQNLS